MKLFFLFVVQFILLVTSAKNSRRSILLGQKDGHDVHVEILINKSEEHNTQQSPVIGKDDGHENKNLLLGGNDDHDNKKGRFVGQPDGHDGQQDSIVGKNDGHKNKEPLFGHNNGHDGLKDSLIGQSDGHDGKQQIIGKDDGHENKRPLLGRNDGHDDLKSKLIGHPDGHEQQGPIIGKDDGHENKRPLLGRNDGHEGQIDSQFEITENENDHKIGKDDGHENHEELDEKDGLIGQDDGHEISNLKFDPENYKKMLGKYKNLPILPISSHDNDEDDTYLFGEDYYDIEIPEETLIDEDSMEEIGIDEEDDDEALVRCKRPMCEMNCQFGFQTDGSGCPICKCFTDPCQSMSCEVGMKCEVQECLDVFKCSKLTAKCIPKKCDGPEPMCANFCQHGYQLNERGCMTCFCRLAPLSTPAHEVGANCGSRVCNIGQICEWKQWSANGPGQLPQCKPKPLCYTAQEESGLSRDINHGGAGLSVDPRIFVPKCREDGSFEPRQCHNIRSECWCVDDRGAEIFGTRSGVYRDDKKPNCKFNQTLAVRLDMVFNDEGRMLDNKPTFEKELVSALVELLSFDEANIDVEKILAYQSPRDDVDKNVKQTRVLLTLIRVLDKDDFPSAIEYLKLVARSEGVAINSNGQTAHLDADSIRYDYIYEESTLLKNKFFGDMSLEDMGHSSLKPWYYCNKLRQHQVMITIILLVLMIITLICAIFMVRRRCNRRHIRHHQLQNKLTFAQNQGLYKREPLKNESVMLITDDALDKEKSNLA